MKDEGISIAECQGGPFDGLQVQMGPTERGICFQTPQGRHHLYRLEGDKLRYEGVGNPPVACKGGVRDV